RERPGNVVKIVHDEDNEVVQIFIQSQEQRELFKKFGEVVEIDGTYKVDKAGMPLYTIVIEDNFGIGQPICYMFLREETTASIFAGLEIFAKHNDVSKTKVVLTDKDCKEMNAVERIFTSASLKLCLFHALAAVDKRLVQAKLSRNLREEIYQQFKEAVYAGSEEKIKEVEEYLCGLDEDDDDGTYDGLGHYFETNWFNITEYWAVFYRRTLFMMDNHTTNRIERYHSTLKKNLRNRQVRFPELIQVLLDISQMREFD
ncbi:Uncharacterized protein APZ42_004573, partial [Daphnia magna]